MTIDRDYTLKTAQELIRIDSRNPGLEAGAPGEWELAQHVSARLDALGWVYEFHDLGGRRANVIARRKGGDQGPSLMINVHLDTVGVAGMEDPFSADYRDGRIWGRGAQDTKGGMAAVLGAAKALTDAGANLRGDLVLAFVADEEHENIGTADLVRRVKTEAAILIEPTDLDICVAHRGFGIFRLTTQGRAAHGGDAALGIDANTHMGYVLVELDRLRQNWAHTHRHDLLGGGGLHVPLMRGGRQLFMYAHECAIDVECRTVPGQTAEGTLADLQALLAALSERIPDFRGAVEPKQWRSPYEIDPNRPIVRTVLAAAETVRGERPDLISHPWWEDSALLGEAGIETVILGPRGGGLHTEREWVEADSVVDLAGILYNSVIAYCGAD